MFSCDYNGWADVPEEEREGLDAFEGSGLTSAKLAPKVETALRLLPVRSSVAGRPAPMIERRRAA